MRGGRNRSPNGAVERALGRCATASCPDWHRRMRARAAPRHADLTEPSVAAIRPDLIPLPITPSVATTAVIIVIVITPTAAHLLFNIRRKWSSDTGSPIAAIQKVVVLVILVARLLLPISLASQLLLNIGRQWCAGPNTTLL
jgi:hypothetical protein